MPIVLNDLVDRGRTVLIIKKGSHIGIEGTNDVGDVTPEPFESRLPAGLRENSSFETHRDMVASPANRRRSAAEKHAHVQDRSHWVPDRQSQTARCEVLRDEEIDQVCSTGLGVSE
jgi:hypothetical protein